MAAVDLDQIGMHELLHDLYLLKCLVNLKGVNMDLFESVEAFFIIADEIDAAKAALSDYLQGFIRLHA